MRLRRWKIFWLIACAAALPTASSRAQEPRPKIGLVLGGGAARGLAHIGVLEWLEEHRVPVDCIAGTSMGGLIGGAYATGMTPRQIRTLMRNVDWDNAFRGEAPYQLKNIRRKEDRRDYPVRLELGLRGGRARLPGGLDPAHPIGLILNRIALPYGTMPTFDDLPLPFRCVAVDLLTADQVVLGEGALSQALRATMAIPGVFTPVEMGGRVLADGALINNVPADVARAMGAEIVIAVDVGAPLDERGGVASLGGVLAQSLRVVIHNNTRQTLRLADTILAPDVEALPSIDWRNSDVIADAGYRAAAARSRFLQTLSLSPSAWQRYLDARRARARSRAPVPEFLVVEGVDSPPARQAIEDRLRRHLGRPIDTTVLEADLTALTGVERYESLGYRLTRENDRDGLLITVRGKSHGPPFVRFAAQVNGAEPERVGFGLGARLTAFDVGGYGAEWRTDLGLGTEQILATEYYRPLPGGQAAGRGWFLAPRAFTRWSIQDVYVEGARVAEYRVGRTGGGMELGYHPDSNSEVRLGYEQAWFSGTLRVGNPLLLNRRGWESAVRLRGLYDGQDSALVPTRGLRASADLRWFLHSPGVEHDFFSAEIAASAFHPVQKRRASVFASLAGGTTFGEDAPAQQQFTLGGPLRLGAYGQNEFRGGNFLLGSTGYLQRIARLPDFAGGYVHAGAWLEYGSVFDTFAAARFRGSVSGGLLAETSLGPTFLGGSLGRGGRAKIYFTLGRFF